MGKKIATKKSSTAGLSMTGGAAMGAAAGALAGPVAAAVGAIVGGVAGATASELIGTKAGVEKREHANTAHA